MKVVVLSCIHKRSVSSPRHLVESVVLINIASMKLYINVCIYGRPCVCTQVINS